MAESNRSNLPDSYIHNVVEVRMSILKLSSSFHLRLSNIHSIKKKRPSYLNIDLYIRLKL